MTTTITYGPDEQDEACRALHATAAFGALYSLQEALRRAARGKGDETAEQQAAAQEWLGRLNYVLESAGINMEELYT